MAKRSPNRRANLTTFTLWALVVSTLAGLIIVLIGLPVAHSDFYDFYLATRALFMGENVYAPQPNGLQGFFNPVWATFPVAPLATLPPVAAFQLWRFASAALLGLAMYAVTRLRGERPSPAWLALAGWLALIPWFVGQNAPLVATGAFLAVLWGAQERWFWAGATMPLLAIKPHTVPLFSLLLLWRGRRPAIAGAIVSLSAVTLVGWALQPGWVLAWLGSRWADSQQGGGQTWASSGLPNFLVLLGLPPWLAVTGILLGLWATWRWRQAPWYTSAGVALAVGTAVTIYVRAADFALLLPALLAMPPRLRYRVTAVLIAIFFARPPRPLMWLIPATTSGVLIWHLLTSPPSADEGE